MNLASRLEKSFMELIEQHQVVQYHDTPIRLKSGILSNLYINWRNVGQSVNSTELLASVVLDFIEGLGIEPDVILGVPEGATKLALLCQYLRAKDLNRDAPFCMGRGKPKEHGSPDDRYYLGTPEGHVLLLEDVTTSGLSVFGELERLQELSSVKKITVLSLVDRSRGAVKDKLWEERRIPYFALADADHLLEKCESVVCEL